MARAAARGAGTTTTTVGTARVARVAPAPAALLRAPGSVGAAGGLVGEFASGRRSTITAEFELSRAKEGPQVLAQEYPSRTLSRREESVFASPETPALPALEDHGFRFYSDEGHLEGRPEAVKRALSTRTASIPEMRLFRKQQLIHKFAEHELDTGSSRVTVALWSERIASMQEHMKKHHKDQSCKRKLESLVSQRRKLLRYMIRTDYENYRVSIKELGLRPLPVFQTKYKSLRGRTESHEAIHDRNSRVKRHVSRGYKGH